MELQLEDYWKVVRPRRAKPIGVLLVSSKLIPLVEWFGSLNHESRSFQVLLGDTRTPALKQLRVKFPLKSILTPSCGSNLVESIFYLLRDLKIPSSCQGELQFFPPSAAEWELIWCLVAKPHSAVSANLLDIVRKDEGLVQLYKALVELRLEASERRILISIEEGIQQLVDSIGSRKRDRTNAVLFLANLAFENGLLKPFLVYLDASSTTNGLLEILQALKTWEPYGNVLKLLIGCEDHTRFVPLLHKHFEEGLAWLKPG